MIGSIPLAVKIVYVLLGVGMAICTLIIMALGFLFILARIPDPLGDDFGHVRGEKGRPYGEKNK